MKKEVVVKKEKRNRRYVVDYITFDKVSNGWLVSGCLELNDSKKTFFPTLSEATNFALIEYK